MRVSKYYYTIRHLKAEQLCFQIYYRLCVKLRGLFGVKEKYSSYKKGNRVSLSPFPEKSETYRGNGIFEFLNLTHRFNGAWDDRSQGDLWRYNLNYMDFVLQPGMNVNEGVEWINRYITDASDNKVVADPYPISLRGINWIKFVSLHWDELSETELKKIDTFLYSQYKVLSRRTERHLLANHYLENGLSLLFAAVYFQDKDFWRQANSIVVQQLKEQIMNDGAHYELSPMYHCILLERVMDCYNLLQGFDDATFDGIDGLKTILCENASKMMSWLDAIVVSGDRIPLLNDSAYGVASSPGQLRNYAERLGITWGFGTLSDSGYRHVVRDGYEAVLDMAQLGVSYNLGHAHADSSTFLLWANGEELLVDTGVSTYNSGERRDYERSTQAHNTVVLDDENSSEIWGAFRCAQRARVVIEEDGPDSFSHWHDGYRKKGVSCHRKFVCRDDAMEVVDLIEGNTKSVATAYFHLSPKVQLLNIEDNCVVTDKAIFLFEGHHSLHILKKEVALEYNRLHPAQCICVRFEHSLHTKIDVSVDKK